MVVLNFQFQLIDVHGRRKNRFLCRKNMLILHCQIVRQATKQRQTFVAEEAMDGCGRGRDEWAAVLL